MEKFFYEINKYKKRKIEKEVIYQNILKNNEILINKKVDVKSFIENKIECSKLLGCPGGGKTTAIINKIIHPCSLQLFDIRNSSKYGLRLCESIIWIYE